MGERWVWQAEPEQLYAHQSQPVAPFSVPNHPVVDTGDGGGLDFLDFQWAVPSDEFDSAGMLRAHVFEGNLGGGSGGGLHAGHFDFANALETGAGGAAHAGSSRVGLPEDDAHRPFAAPPTNTDNRDILSDEGHSDGSLVGHYLDLGDSRAKDDKDEVLEPLDDRDMDDIVFKSSLLGNADLGDSGEDSADFVHDARIALMKKEEASISLCERWQSMIMANVFT